MKAELYTDIPGYEGRYLLSASGTVYSVLRGKPMRSWRSREGRQCFTLVDAEGKRHSHSLERLYQRVLASYLRSFGVILGE